MEWVETTGRTLEEAKEAALDQLGVDETDAEFEVLEQPKAGLFGRMRGEARVRARVRPTSPRAKDDRRERRRRGKSPSAGSGSGNGGPATRDDSSKGGETPARGSRSEPAAATDSASDGSDEAAPGKPRRRRRRSSKGGSVEQPVERAGAGQAGPRNAGTREPRTEQSNRRDGAEVEVPLQDQGRVAEDFLSGLVNEFGLSANVTINQRDDENLDLALSGRDLGLLIGQKGTTLLAVQDLTRTVVQHKTSASNGRIHVDVGGYRQKRNEALAKFAHEVAAKVKQTGERTALEPMSAPDRKVVHDAITDLEGVGTISEGEEPRRRVVIIPSE